MAIDAAVESVLTNDGQATIPLAVRDALKLRTGDTLHFGVEGDRIVIEVRRHPGLASLAGSLKSYGEKGKGMTFDEIREAAFQNASSDGYFDKYK